MTLREVNGNWDQGWVLDKHTQSSTYLGDDAHGHPRFETIRTGVGEATYQLKYMHDWNQVEPLARCLADYIFPRFHSVGFIVPMPASTVRARQPVVEVAKALGAMVAVPVFTNTLRKANIGQALKDMHTKDEKMTAIGDSFSVNDEIEGAGPWNVLIVDDLFHTGASMESACKVLRAFPKVRKIYVAALTWRS